MSFLTPIAFAFAATLPVVVLFYLLKRRRVIKLSSSTVLWQRFLADSQANAPFQRLRKNWLMVLQLLLLALLVAALARPYFQGTLAPARLRVLVLDASASMQSTDETPSRFERAKAEARAWIDGQQGDQQLMLLYAGAVTEVRQSPTRDTAALRRALDACQPSEGRTRLVEALQTASAFTYEQRGETLEISGEIHLFSDGAVWDLESLANKNLPLVYHRIGKRGNNAGIVSLDLRANPDNPAERALFAGVLNASTHPISTQVSLEFNGQVLEVKSLELAPTNTTPLVFVARQEVDGVFRVRLLAEDDLAADNEASIYSLLPRPLKVTLITRGNRFLEKGIRAVPNTQLTVVGPESLPVPPFDVVVLDDILPASWPEASTLAIRAAPRNWFQSLLTETNPPILDWHRSHPVLRSVNLDNVDVAESLLPELPPWGIGLVVSQQRPMVVAGETPQRHRTVWIGFDPLQSNWPLRISFPIFLANALEWLNPVLSRSSDLMLRPGDPFHRVFAKPVTSAEVILPEGTRRTLPPGVNPAEVLFGDTLQRGVYRMEAGDEKVTFCVNLLDASESSTTPRDTLPFGKYSGVVSSTQKKANSELWRWWAAAGLLVLLLEWGYFHHRTV